MDATQTLLTDSSPYAQPATATVFQPLPPGTRLIPQVDQSADLSSNPGRLYLVNETLYLAQREAERGERANANAQLQKAYQQAAQIADPGYQAQALAWYSSMVDYCSKLAPNAPSLQGAAAVSDATYEKSQILTAGQQNEFAMDNADTQRALDAQASGQNPTAAYEAGAVARTVEATAKGVKDGVQATVGAALSPFSTWILVGLGILTLGVGLYAYMTVRGARAVTGAV